MIRFGIIGTNIISHKLMEASKGIREFELTAVYSRDLDTAKEFGTRYRVENYFNDLTEFAKSDTFDAVYIASPNSCHCEQAILMMEHGKHVLCEKPIASNSKELRKMFAAAKKNKVILLEAMRSAFAPEFTALRKHLYKLGNIRKAEFRYCQYSSRYDAYKDGKIANVFNPEFSGGAIMDLGVYCIYLMTAIFGAPKTVKGSGVLLENGIDAAGTVLLEYPDMIGEVEYSKVNYSYLPSQIQGEKACMIISQIDSTKDVEIRYNNGFKEVIHYEQMDNNMEHEIRAFLRMIKGEEDPEPYAQYSKMTMQILDKARRSIGITFPADGTKTAK